MRILMLAQFYPPVMGGEEQHVRNLSAALAARGHEVAVATLWHEGAAEFERDGDVRVYRLRSTMQRLSGLFSTERRFAPPFPDPEGVAALRRVVRLERPEIVHAHNWLVHSFLPLKPWSGARLVVTLHDYSLVCAQKRLMRRDTARCVGPGVRKCLDCAAHHYGPAKGVPIVLANRASGGAARAAADLFLPVSRAVADGNGLPRHRVPFRVVPNFVPDDVAAPRGDTSPYIAQLPGEGYLLFVGDLVRDKGIAVLLDAYARLAAAPPLVLIGRVRPETPAALPPHVVVRQNWPHDAVMAAWRRSLLGLVPSLCPDSCPTVAMEAMATGRPVVASRIGGLPDLVDDGETGFLIPPGDPEALRRALARLLADPDLRARMGEAARRKVREFQASTVVARIEGLYGDLLRSRPHVGASTASWPTKGREGADG